MVSRLALLAAVVLLAAAGARAQPAGQLIGGEVESLLEFARSRHPEFAALRAEAAAAAERVEPAGALPDPMFRTELRDITNEGKDASSNLLPPRIGSTRYIFSQSVPWFGKRDLRRDVAGAGADEAQARARAGWIELATRIKLAYAQHHVHLVSIRYAQENLDLMRRVAEISRTRYASGFGSQQDALRAQSEIIAMETDLVMLEGESKQTAARIRALLGRPENLTLRPPEKLRLLPPPAKLEMAELEGRLKANNPQLAADNARIAGAEKGRDLVERNRYPDVSFGVAPTQVGKRVAEWELMLELNIPLQQESRRAQEREAELMVDAARLRRQGNLNQALAELSESLAGLEVARRLESLVSTGLLPQAELNLNSALAAYENGRVDFAAVLDAHRQLRRARGELVKARGDQQIRLAEIEKMLGEDL
ncbi:MAG: TolC family protein [Sulfuritalea sp.]|jgi:cobalt-zinc-cadmium efflux system outer membrane protein|nr:TolC family protein [Sulfuritalea sp.]